MSDFLNLSKPLITHKGEVTQLEFKEPTAGAYVNYGDPFKIPASGLPADITYNDKAVIGFLSEMTGIDQIILRGLPAGDYMTARIKMVDVIIKSVGGGTENPTN
jgi:hypothetical protein